MKRKQMVTEIKAALTVCDEHFVPISVDIENAETRKRERIDLQKGPLYHIRKK